MPRNFELSNGLVPSSLGRFDLVGIGYLPNGMSPRFQITCPFVEIDYANGCDSADEWIPRQGTEYIRSPW